MCQCVRFSGGWTLRYYIWRIYIWRMYLTSHIISSSYVSLILYLTHWHKEGFQSSKCMKWLTKMFRIFVSEGVSCVREGLTQEQLDIRCPTQMTRRRALELQDSVPTVLQFSNVKIWACFLRIKLVVGLYLSPSNVWIFREESEQ